MRGDGDSSSKFSIKVFRIPSKTSICLALLLLWIWHSPYPIYRVKIIITFLFRKILKNPSTWYKWVNFSIKSQSLPHWLIRSSSFSRSFESFKLSFRTSVNHSVACCKFWWNKWSIMSQPSFQSVWGARQPVAVVCQSACGFPDMLMATSLEYSWSRSRVCMNRSYTFSLENFVADARSRSRSTRMTDTLLVAVCQN